MRRHNFIGLAYQFWNLTRESIIEMEKLNNRTMIVSDFNPNQIDEESWVKYEYDTRWNDFNVGVPILFNFYHGLELFMKGLSQEIGKLKETEMNHGLKEIFQSIVENSDSFTQEIIELLEYFIKLENPFQQFFEDNKGSIDDFYIFLRYPSAKKSETNYTFKEIRGNEQVGLERFKIIKKGCFDLKQSVVKWKTNVA